jgi:hypothetical protein
MLLHVMVCTGVRSSFVKLRGALPSTVPPRLLTRPTNVREEDNENTCASIDVCTGIGLHVTD